MNYIYKLKKIMETKKYTQNDLAFHLGVSFATVNKWLNSKATPRLKTQNKIKQAYNKLVSSQSLSSPKTIGLIEGGGTGQELVNVFRFYIERVAKASNIAVDFLSFFEEFGYRAHSFWELRDKYYKSNYSSVESIVKKETYDILKFDDILLSKNYAGIFRSAINAETLYYLRAIAKTIKVVPIQIPLTKRTVNLLFIRDQIQGFYTNENIKVHTDSVEINVIYSHDNFEKMVRFFKSYIKREDLRINKLIFIYKFHIVGIELQKLIDRVMKAVNMEIDYEIMQPDSGMHYLLHDIEKDDKTKNIAVIVGNEIGDVLLEAIIHYYNLGTKESVFTSNYVLGKKEIEALQTMHGSADNISGQQIVNPTATLKAAAYAGEKWLGIKNLQSETAKSIKKATAEKLGTPDTGGKNTTKDFMEAVLGYINKDH